MTKLHKSSHMQSFLDEKGHRFWLNSNTPGNKRLPKWHVSHVLNIGEMANIPPKKHKQANLIHSFMAEYYNIEWNKLIQPKNEIEERVASICHDVRSFWATCFRPPHGPDLGTPPKNQGVRRRPRHRTGWLHQSSFHMRDLMAAGQGQFFNQQRYGGWKKSSITLDETL